jgi:hypothetical protein
VIEIRITRGLRRQHRVSCINIVVAHVFVIGREIAGEAAKLIGLGCHAGDEARDVIGRTAQHAVAHLGNAAMGQRSCFEILSRLRFQKIFAEAFAVLFKRHRIAVLRRGLDVVDRRHRACGIAKRRMHGDVGDLFPADVDGSAVAQGLQMLVASLQHGHALRSVALHVKVDNRNISRKSINAFSAFVSLQS